MKHILPTLHTEQRSLEGQENGHCYVDNNAVSTSHHFIPDSDGKNNLTASIHLCVVSCTASLSNESQILNPPPLPSYTWGQSHNSMLRYISYPTTHYNYDTYVYANAVTQCNAVIITKANFNYILVGVLAAKSYLLILPKWLKLLYSTLKSLTF